MKIVLRQDVEKLGEKGTVQNVSDGFARNYLIPKGLAVLATPGELKVLAENQRVRDIKIAHQERDLQTLADKISAAKLSFEARAGEQGRLYGSITAGDIADKLTIVTGQEIDRRKVVLDDQIRTVGEHTAHVHLVGKLRPQVTIKVTAIVEEVEEPAAAEVSPEAE